MPTHRGSTKSNELLEIIAIIGVELVSLCLGQWVSEPRWSSTYYGGADVVLGIGVKVDGAGFLAFLVSLTVVSTSPSL